MMEGLVCWKCGASIAEHPLPLARAAECRSCRADLHVCKMCEHYDPRVAKSCREPIAEEVNDKERSNFCGYFKAKPGAYNATDHSVAAAARAKLEALFGRKRGRIEFSSRLSRRPSEAASRPCVWVERQALQIVDQSI